jgi:hypothetical protein
MENLEYFRILVSGYFNHGSFLKDHIYREFKKAEKNFITKDEFFTRCDYIIKWLENEFDKLVNEQKKDWYDVLDYLEHEPGKVEPGAIPIDQHILQLENLLKTISRNNFPVNLRHIRGIPADYYMDFQHEINYSDVQYIETAIKEAMSMALPDDMAKDIQEPEQPKGKGKPLPEKPFHEYILHEKNVQIAEQLKSEFKTEKGKSIRLIIEVLIEKKMFTIENRQRQKIYDAMKKYFDRYIGSKQSIFDYEINEISDRPDFESIELKINIILSRINKIK